MGIAGAVRVAAVWAVAKAGIRSDRGATSVEYGIMAAMIVSVVIVAVIFLGQRKSQSFSCMTSNLDAGTAAAGC